MKEERLAILSMVEKGIINVDEAERLLKAIGGFAQAETTIGGVFSKAGELAKTAAAKTEKIIDNAKPAVKKAADDAAPAVKKAADKLKEKAESFKIFKKGSDDGLSDDDFEQDVTIIPVSADENAVVIDETVEEAEEKTEE